MVQDVGMQLVVSLRPLLLMDQLGLSHVKYKKLPLSNCIVNTEVVCIGLIAKIQTSIYDGYAKEVASLSVCQYVGSTFTCCLTTATGEPCNKVVTCNDPQKSRIIGCNYLGVNNVFACAVKFNYTCLKLH